MGIRNGPEHHYRQTLVIQGGQANVGMLKTTGETDFGGRRCTCLEAFEVGLAEPWGEIGNVIGNGWPDLKAWFGDGGGLRFTEISLRVSQTGSRYSKMRRCCWEVVTMVEKGTGCRAILAAIGQHNDARRFP